LSVWSLRWQKELFGHRTGSANTRNSDPVRQMRVEAGPQAMEERPSSETLLDLRQVR